jgi:uncharacterized oligopeptide transporter (OPT) family protein
MSEPVAPVGRASAGSHGHRLTLRSLVAGYLLAVLLCAVNTYLTLRFGIIEEGAMIAALFFFSALYFSALLRRVLRGARGGGRTGEAAAASGARPATAAELVMVATMGSAGGSLGFIANFFAAKAMTSTPYTVPEMALFAMVSGTIGIISTIAFRYLLIVREDELPEDRRLPWVGAKVVKGVLDPLLGAGDPRQPRYLALLTAAAIVWVLLNDSGVGWLPERVEIAVLGLSAYGAGIVLAPFALGSSFIMGFRTVVGFFCGGVVLVALAPALPAELRTSPQQYLWPGVMFLVTSGLTALALRWRVVYDSLRSLGPVAATGRDDDPIMGVRATAVVALAAIAVASAVLTFVFAVPLVITVVMIVVGGGLLNLIATRAYAQTAFNPVRVMGVLLQGIAASLGGASVGTNLTGSGFIAGSGTQCSTLSSDLWVGRAYRVPSRWQFWAQSFTVLSCGVVCALTFDLINRATPLTFDSMTLAAPAAKMWAVIGMLFDPASSRGLPPFAVPSMWIGGSVGVLWALAEQSARIRRFVPGSVGFGMGLVIHPSISIAFFLAGVLMWIVLRRFLKLSDETLGTIAIASIVGEGLGGLSQGVLRAFGVLG